MTQKTMIEKLRAIPAFETFSEAALEKLASYVTVRTLGKGDAVFQEGDAGDTVHVVEGGEVEIRKGDRTLAVLQAGQLFGEMALFESEKRSAGAVANGEATVYAIRNEDFLNFLFEQPEAGSRFLYATVQEMSRRLRRTSEYLTTVFETGKIVGAGLSLAAMSERILRRLLDDVEEATGGVIIVFNPFTESYEAASASDAKLVDVDDVAAFVERHAGEDRFQETTGGQVLGVALKDEGKVLGYILLEKAESATPFSVEQEIVVDAVSQQVGLGILQAYSRQEDEARERLERGRMRGY